MCPVQIQDQADIPPQAGHVLSTGDDWKWLALSRLPVLIWVLERKALVSMYFQ